MYMARNPNPEPISLLRKKTDSPLATALREEIRRLVDTEPFTLGTLRSIERVAEHGRLILISQAELTVGEAIENLEDVVSPLVDPMENFGARAIREIIGGLNKPKAPPPVETIRAIAEARKLGLTELADELELSIRPPAESAPSDPDTIAASKGELS